MLLVQYNRAAQNSRVHVGMTPSQALARNLNLIVKARARAQEKRMEEILLHFAFTLSPLVEATAFGLCTIEFKIDKNIALNVERVIDQLAAAKIVAQVGIGPTPDMSLLAAH